MSKRSQKQYQNAYNKHPNNINYREIFTKSETSNDHQLFIWPQRAYFEPFRPAHVLPTASRRSVFARTGRAFNFPARSPRLFIYTYCCKTRNDNGALCQSNRRHSIVLILFVFLSQCLQYCRVALLHVSWVACAFKSVVFFVLFIYFSRVLSTCWKSRGPFFYLFFFTNPFYLLWKNAAGALAG